jgi:hypothetical protein
MLFVCCISNSVLWLNKLLEVIELALNAHSLDTADTKTTYPHVEQVFYLGKSYEPREGLHIELSSSAEKGRSSNGVVSA